MRTIFILSAAVIALAGTAPAEAGFFDSFFGEGGSATASPDTRTVVGGLKEALAVGTERAVKSLGRENGYFGDNAVKLLMPEKMRSTADILANLGFRREVDEFILSMNRAAEKAAPQAAGIFGGAVKEMSFEDAMAIYRGGDTAATAYFEKKTRGKLAEAFRPVVVKSLDQVGATRSYRDLVARVETIPFVSAESLDLESYVTGKALDGLFLRLGEEEKKIRTNPVARSTEILRAVFGK